MTTVIYDCDAGDLSPQSITRLANMYHESEATTEWQPGEDLSEKLVITPISKEIADQLDIAEEDLIHIDEAMELLQSDVSMSDVITHGNEAFARDDPITLQQCLMLAKLTIDHSLSSESIPQHEKSGLRVISAVIKATNEFAKEIETAVPDDHRIFCARKLIILKDEILKISVDTALGKFHDQRSQQEEPTT
ncbi:hypothetical protein [Nitrosomonas marina]|uniref:Uncharacterized protein n=1 Tax=Nitrosomonas marina TaxID=917 RepID=A0A1H8GKW1_9PROT|nr:hypothetical protein [Nitrosomonas marina]SEN43948.1 hypothetical protein SAMN05216325_11850 [Nitrosomonas marina]